MQSAAGRRGPAAWKILEIASPSRVDVGNRFGDRPSDRIVSHIVDETITVFRPDLAFVAIEESDLRVSCPGAVLCRGDNRQGRGDRLNLISAREESVGEAGGFSAGTVGISV